MIFLCQVVSINYQKNSDNLNKYYNRKIIKLEWSTWVIPSSVPTLSQLLCPGVRGCRSKLAGSWLLNWGLMNLCILGKEIPYGFCGPAQEGSSVFYSQTKFQIFLSHHSQVQSPVLRAQSQRKGPSLSLTQPLSLLSRQSYSFFFPISGIC